MTTRRLLPDSNQNTQRAYDNARAYAYSRDNGHLRFMSKAQTCESFLAGRQWDGQSLSKLKRQRRPALTINRTLPQFAAISAEQLMNNADIGFKPANASADADTAAVLNKVFIWIGQQNNLDWIESQVFDDGTVTSRGFFDVRMNFDKNLAGDIQIKAKNPQNIALDPDAEEYDPRTWGDVIETKWLSADQLVVLYGHDAVEELINRVESTFPYAYDYIDPRPGTFGHTNTIGGQGTEVWDQHATDPLFRTNLDTMHSRPRYRRLYRLIDRQFKTIRMREHFVDPVTGDMREIPPSMPRFKIQRILEEFNLAVIRRKTEVIWWRTSSDSLLLHDAQSPYRSYTIVPYFPFFRHGETVGLVENMIDPARLYNKIRSQELHVVNSTANSGWRVKQNSLTNMTLEDLEERGAETGLVVETKEIGDAEKIQPNQVPTGLERISFNAAEDLKATSMVSDSLRGFDRADVAAKAIQAKQARGSTNFARPMANLSYTRELLGTKVLELVQTFMTEPRVLRITGNLPGEEDEEISINEIDAAGQVTRDLTVGDYAVVVTSVPARETFSESQFQQGVQLRELQVPIPNSFLVANSNLANRKELADRLAQQEDPQEESALDQAVAELEIEQKRLENQKIQAERLKIESETALNLVEAQKRAESPTEEQVQATEAENEQEKFIAERRQALAELAQKQEQIDNDLMINLQELNIKREQQRSEAAAKLISLDNQRRQTRTRTQNQTP